MKKCFETPEMMVREFTVEDIVTASSDPLFPDEGERD